MQHCINVLSQNINVDANKAGAIMFWYIVSYKCLSMNNQLSVIWQTLIDWILINFITINSSLV